MGEKDSREEIIRAFRLSGTSASTLPTFTLSIILTLDFPSHVCFLTNCASDDDETGRISFKNLKRVAKELEETMTDEELQEMVDETDRDGDNEINEEEFLRIMKKTSLY